MRDPDLLVELLRKMNDAEDGRLLSPNTLGGRNQKERHQLEILADAGHAKWISDHVIRITNDGYDFLNAIDKGGDTWDKFLEYLDKGMKYVTAARKVIEVVGTVS